MLTTCVQFRRRSTPPSICIEKFHCKLHRRRRATAIVRRSTLPTVPVTWFIGPQGSMHHRVAAKVQLTVSIGRGFDDADPSAFTLLAAGAVDDGRSTGRRTADDGAGGGSQRTRIPLALSLILFVLFERILFMSVHRIN
ncbi:hypothetical protein GWI33_021565 [Rhynchophorus ferrugineus]|uniref:Uncharacterized protein n=1 Tax=Rhynchophorus ferrugineus TaxID=354439 RepID=A0A834IPH0_RHYFE|nr:hypothetical protein GWI33_021565 [Rhynchophorus ferrugineus]